MLPFLRRQWFLVALVLVLVGGFCFPEQFRGVAFADRFRRCVVFAVLFLMSLPMETAAVWQAIKRPWPALLASILNFGIVPILAFAVSRAFTGDLAIGVILAGASPCTMASAAVWTRRAGGNDAISILVTIITNSTCFVVTPLWLVTLLGQSVDIALWPMISNLVVLIVLPMTLGQIVRQWKPLGIWATQHKRRISSFAQSGILIMVLIGSTRIGLEFDWRDQLTVPQFIAMCIGMVGLHLVCLFSFRHVAKILRMESADQIAVAIAGSQKTLMIALHIAINYFGGLAMLPMIVYHVGQLVFDTIIADVWVKADD